MRGLYFFLAIQAVCLFPITAACEPSGVDFDGDGIADITGYEIQRDGSPNEIALTFISSSTGTVTRTEYGKSSQLPIPADYDGDGVTDLAIVGPDDADQFVWRMKLSGAGGEESSSTFGQLGGTILSGCSLDSDAKADRAIFFGERYISIEQSADSTVSTLDLGIDGLDFMTCGDVTGDGRNDLVGQKTAAGGQSIFYAWDTAGAGKILEQQFGSSVGAILTADIDGDGRREIGYVKKRGSSARVIEFLKDGAAVSIRFPKFLYASVARTSTAAGAPDGIYLKAPANDRFFRVASLAAPAVIETVSIFDTASVLSGVNFGYPGPVRSKETACQVNHEPNDGNEGFLWKPVSDTNGRAVAILPRGIRLKKVRLVKNGRDLESLYFGGNGNGGRDHWRSRYRATTFSTFTTLMGVQGGVTHCWLISDPLQRLD